MKKGNLLFLHRVYPRNAGDWYSCPAHYFEFDAPITCTDITALPEDFDLSGFSAIVVGGGGLLANATFERSIRQVAALSATQRILWGVGLNTHYLAKQILFNTPFRERVQYRFYELLKMRSIFKAPSIIKPSTESHDLSILREFNLAGIRDWLPECRWVPCASCLHPIFDEYRSTRPKYDVVVFENREFCRVAWNGSPRYANFGASLREVIRFLSSGETILTSSYHGAYWGILLGRKVVTVPWSSKFRYFKHPLTLCESPRQIGDCLRRARAYPNALEECRRANYEFAAEVSKLLGIAVAPKFSIA